MNTEQARQLLMAAKMAAAGAYAPYSNFPVGAALLCEDGAVITGVNIENASYGLTTCAERVAVYKAVSEGRKKIKAVAVWAGMRPNGNVTPCGACRQVLSEFGAATMPVIMADIETDEPLVMTLDELLPRAFEK